MVLMAEEQNQIYKKVGDYENLTFSAAFSSLRNFEKDEPNQYGIRRATWNYRNVICIQNPDENSKMTAPYLYKRNVESGNCVPCTISNELLFADDWEVVSFADSDVIKKMTASYNPENKEDNQKNQTKAWFNNNKLKANDATVEAYENYVNDLLNNKPKTVNDNDSIDSIVKSARRLITAVKEYDKKHNCSPHCRKKCLNECNKDISNIITKEDVEEATNYFLHNADTFDKFIDAMLG